VREETADFVAGDGACAGRLLVPDGPGPHACVVLGHGFTAVRDQRLDAFAEAFAAAGLATLAFDYRGFGRSPGEPRQVLDPKAQLEDWRSAVAWVRAREDLDPERVAAWGSSFAGGHVLALAAEDRRFAAAVAVVPFVDGPRNLLHLPWASVAGLVVPAVRDLGRRRRGGPPVLVPAVGAPGDPAVLTTPSCAPGFAAITPPDSTWRNEVAARIGLLVLAYSPGRRAGKITCPVLACIGREDDLTPPGFAEKAMRRVPRGEVVHYDAGHFDLYDGEGFDRASADQTGFLRRHLLGAG
jgi:uncharacterized protein